VIIFHGGKVYQIEAIKSNTIELPPATSWSTLYRLKSAKGKTNQHRNSHEVKPKKLHTVCILKSSPKGEGFPLRVRQWAMVQVIGQRADSR
jgi:hypothetical protein